MKNKFFLPVSNEDLQSRKIKQLDIIIITGDAYIDHPSFGAALLGRFLEQKGFSVGIISQPQTKLDFHKLGEPRLWWGITSGNMDSMINHYTAQRKIRSTDAYSEDGKRGKRPDRAVIRYSQSVRKYFKNAFIVIGGIEASLRRIPHYDYWTDSFRNSILFDSQADILVYGMGERTSLEISWARKNNTSLSSILGTVVGENSKPSEIEQLFLPAYHKKFSIADYRQLHLDFERNFLTKTLYIPFGNRCLKHNPPSKSLSEKEIDEVYQSDFTRLPHPDYKKKIPAFEQIKLSVTTHRGCFGGCSFCSIGKHQGKTIQTRSSDSIKNEVHSISQHSYFHGTISDIGGPTANMYGMKCGKDISDSCTRKSCLQPTFCDFLRIDHKYYKNLLEEIRTLPSLKHLFIASGIRHDLAINDNDFIKMLVKHHTSGFVKLAPEHFSKNVLALMNKPDFVLYEKFCKTFYHFSNIFKKKQAIIPYLIIGHPGSTPSDVIDLAIYLKKNDIQLKQIQEFIPLPMTISTLYYVTGRDEKNVPLYVAKGREIRLRKALVQWFKPENKKYIIEFLRFSNRKDLIHFFLKK